MTFTTIIVSGTRIDNNQRTFLIQSGFAISGVNLSRSVKTEQLHMVIGQLVVKNIPFNLKTSPPTYAQSPCAGCKK